MEGRLERECVRGSALSFLLGVAYLGVCRVPMPRGLECVRIAAVAALTRWAVQADRYIPSTNSPIQL